MEALLFSSGEDHLELTVAPETDASLQSFGDAYVTVQVCSNGFAGHDDLWVLRESLGSFCKSLIALERTLRGEARLESASPNELDLRVASVSSRGNVAVSGKVGYRVSRENSEHWHSVEFGFEFEPSQLSNAASLPWVRQYAG
jgi:hypothetical protein